MAQESWIWGPGISPAPLWRPFSLLPRSRSANEEIFEDELADFRGQRLFADPAMDQSMVGVSFHAHDLVDRPAAGANKLSRMVLGIDSSPAVPRAPAH